MNTANSEQLSVHPRECRLPAAWAALILVDLCLICFAAGPHSRVAAQTTDLDDEWTVVQVDSPDEPERQTPRFEALDVYVDSGDRPLAAWQMELVTDTPGIEIAGIEGGEHAAYQKPPYYDARAMRQNRVVLASYDDGDELPTGNSRVARVHVQIAGAGLCEYRVKLSAAASADGERIPAEITLEKAGQ